MKILMVSSELVPFAKIGGLADVVSALSVALSQKGHDVKVVLPRYYKIDRKKLKKIADFVPVDLGIHEYHVNVFEANMLDSDVMAYFIGHEEFFGREGIYGNNAEPDFSDNPKRFSLLANGAFQVCRKLGWIPDVIHSHDWASGLMPALLKYKENNSEFKNTASVFTIHNIGLQGVYPKHFFPDTGLDWDDFYNTGCEDWDRINFLKSALVSADKITTVSEKYAEEIKRPEFGFRMDSILKYREQDLVGIINGVDTSIWHPEKDKLLPYPYSVNNLEEKEKNKIVLQEKMGLPLDPSVPVFGMVTRLVEQKGVSELFGPSYGSAFKMCSELKIQLAILGTGEKWCENELMSLASKLPNLKVFIGYNDELSHLIEAGSDFFLMPSRYEPCGLNQMYSLLYGTIPVVRNTGGLADTVKKYDETTGEGFGFVLDYLSPQSIYDTVSWATYVWNNKKEDIKNMRIRGMNKNFGWSVSAEKYIKLYSDAIAQKKGV